MRKTHFYLIFVNTEYKRIQASTKVLIEIVPNRTHENILEVNAKP